MEKILSAKKTCELLSTSRSTLWRLQQKKLLIPRRLGGKVAYLQSEVEAFMAGLPAAKGNNWRSQPTTTCAGEKAPVMVSPAG